MSADCENVSYDVLVDEMTGSIIKMPNGSEDVLLESDSKVKLVPGETGISNITPIHAYMSTNLNSKIKSYEDIATRILNMLGYPSVGINDLHRDQIYEAISIAVETYMQYCGYTDELLVFDSYLYEENKGIRIDQLYTIASMQSTRSSGAMQKVIDRGPGHNIKVNKEKEVFANEG